GEGGGGGGSGGVGGARGGGGVRGGGGPADMKAADAEEFFKTVVVQPGGTPEDVGQIVLKPKYAPRLRIAFKFPDDHGALRSDDNLYLFWPKDAEGGAKLIVALMDAKIEGVADRDK